MDTSNGSVFTEFVSEQLSNAPGTELYRLWDVDKHNKPFIFVLFKQDIYMFIVKLFTESNTDASSSSVDAPFAISTVNFDSRDSADDFIQKQRDIQKGVPECVELKSRGLLSPETGMLNVVSRHELKTILVEECSNAVNESVAKAFRGAEVYRKTGERKTGQRFVFVVSKLDYYIVRVILEPVKRQNASFDANIDWYSCTVHLPQIKEPEAIDNWVAQTGDYLIDGKEPVFLAHWACQRRIVKCPLNEQTVSALEPGDHIRRKFRIDTPSYSYDSYQEGIYLGDRNVTCFTTDNALLKSKKSACVCTVTLDEFMKGENTLHLVLYRSPHRCGAKIVETAKKLGRGRKWNNSSKESGKNNELFVFLCVHSMVNPSASSKWCMLFLFFAFCLLLGTAVVYLPPRFLSMVVYTFLLTLLMLYGFREKYYTSWAAKQKEAWKSYTRLYKNDCTNFDKFVSQKLNNASAHEVYRIRDVDENGKPFLFVFFQRFGVITVVWIREPPKDYNGCFIDDDNIMMSKRFWFRSSADDFIQRRRNQLKGLPRCVELKRNGLLSKEKGKPFASSIANSSHGTESETETESFHNFIVTNSSQVTRSTIHGITVNPNWDPERFKKFEAFVFLSVSLGFRGEEVNRQFGITAAGQYFVFIVSKIDYYIVRIVLEPDERFNGTLLEKMYLYSCTIHLPRITKSDKITNWVKETSAHFVTKEKFILNDWARDGKHVKTCLRDMEACQFTLKPGDHIRRNLKFWKLRPTYHDGIYIGNGKVAHYTVERAFNIFNEHSGTAIVTLEQFLKGESYFYLVLYRSPDRKGDEIAKIANQCVESNVWHRDYHLAYKNCQLFASYCVRENENPKPKSVPEVKKWVLSLRFMIAVFLICVFLMLVPPYHYRAWFFDMLESVTFLYGAGFDLHEFPERNLDDIFLTDWSAILELFRTTYFIILVAFVLLLLILAWVRELFQSKAWNECKAAVAPNASSDRQPLLRSVSF